MKILKTILLEVLGFFLLCVCGSVLGGFLFMLYGASTSYVIGNNINVFLPNAFLDGMLICFPPLLLFVPMFRMLSLVRHESKNKLFGIITIAVLSLVTWIFCVPICGKAVVASNALEEKKPSELTAGYFRKMNGKMYYFNSITGNYYDALRFENDYSKRNDQDRKVELVKNRYFNFKRDAYGFSDSLVGDYLKPPTVVSKFFLGLISMEKKAYEAASSGVLNWLRFSTIMFALLASCALISASVWRLVSTFWILLSTSLTIVLNYLYIDSFFDDFLNGLGSRGIFFEFLQINFQVIMNFLIVIVLVLTGVLCMIFNNNHLSEIGDFDGDDL